MRSYARTLVLGAAVVALHHPDADAQDPRSDTTAASTIAGADNGITVAPPKIYDDRTLQIMLMDLADQLSDVAGVDRASITSKFGNLQGYESRQQAFSAQLSGPAMPGFERTIVQGQPSTVVTTAGQYPGTTDTTPGETVTTKTTAGAFAPPSVALPTYGAGAAPGALSVSSIDTLNEQVQLNYELMNLRLLLGGSLSDDYVGDGIGRRHVTFGFPISVDAPKRYRKALAEVTVTICNPQTDVVGTPVLQNLLPREKTYNVASLVSSSSQLGAGAVLANVVSIGGSFMQGRQTYHVVRDQDTIALHRSEPLPNARCSTAGSKPTTGASSPNNISFAWQFRPVLGRSTIQQGMRQTFAQVAFPPGSKIPDSSFLTIFTRTCWRTYDRRTGSAGDYVKGSCRNSDPIPTQIEFRTTRIDRVTTTDNGDGTLTAIVKGTYPAGTRVGFGDLVSGPGNIGFSNTAGRLRFTSPLQLVATRGARIISSDGTEREISSEEKAVEKVADDSAVLAGRFDVGTKLRVDGTEFALARFNDRTKVVGWRPRSDADTIAGVRKGLIERPDGSTCRVPNDPEEDEHVRDEPATVSPFSDGLVKITLPIVICPEFGPRVGGPFPLVAVMAGKAYGLTDAPFIQQNSKEIAFLAPRSSLQGQTSLVLKRLFAGPEYAVRYELKYGLGSTAGISVFAVDESDVTFAVRGSQLNRARIIRPAGINMEIIDDTLLMFTIPKDRLNGVKSVLLALDRGATVLLNLPVLNQEPNRKPSVKDGARVSRTVPQPIVIGGTNLKSVVAVNYLGRPLPFTRAANGESVTITQIPPEMILGEGVIPLRILFADETAQDYDLEIVP